MQMAVSFLEHPLYKKFLELKCDRRVVTHFWPPVASVAGSTIERGQDEM